jgi:hypothetical protein
MFIPKFTSPMPVVPAPSGRLILSGGVALYGLLRPETITCASPLVTLPVMLGLARLIVLPLGAEISTLDKFTAPFSVKFSADCTHVPVSIPVQQLHGVTLAVQAAFGSVPTSSPPFIIKPNMPQLPAPLPVQQPVGAPLPVQAEFNVAQSGELLDSLAYI